jgi:hypothetical protein
MGNFFKRSGNTRGVFPDHSIEEDRSLFTNDEECPGSCSVADNNNIPTPQPNQCQPASPYVHEITQEDFNLN